MINQKNLRRYAEKLVIESELCSEEEHLGVRIIALLGYAHTPEMVLEKLKKDLPTALLAGEDTAPIKAAIQKIQEG